MNDLKLGEHDVLSLLQPSSWIGALVYLVLFVLVAMRVVDLQVVATIHDRARAAGETTARIRRSRLV